MGNYLAHHGVKGQRWGIRRYQNKDGTTLDNSVTSSNLFVSGSSKTQFSDSGYFRRKLPREVRKYLDYEMKKQTNILVGDAPGIDRQVQDHLKKKKYANVEIYSPGKTNRYSADKNWKINYINSNHPEGSKEWLREKDIAMTNRATKGLAVRLDEGSNATRNNIDRLVSQNKNVKIYELHKRGQRYDKWI